MRQISFRRLVVGIGLALPAALILTPFAAATWTAGGSGRTSSLAYTMPTGSQPTASASGNSVSLRWAGALFPDNRSVAGYVVHRYNSVNGAPATVGAGCSGTVAGTTCTELNVPSGSWIYTDTPVQDNWTGGASVASAAVTVP